jgi:hypothetical protein
MFAELLFVRMAANALCERIEARAKAAHTLDKEFREKRRMIGFSGNMVTRSG